MGSHCEQTARALEVIGDRRQRLVQFMRQRRSHFAHRGQTRNMDQFGLQFLQPRFGFLRSVRSRMKPVKKASSRISSRRCQFHREGRAVLAFADHHAADADDAALARPQIAFEIAVMLFAIRRRHQHADILADHLVGA